MNDERYENRSGASLCARCRTPAECAERGCAFPETVASPDLFGLAVTKYRVVGKGSFPLDMLRVDHAWPCRTHDSARIINSYGNEGEQVVSLCSLQAPNFRLWLASSWRITEINGVFV